MSFLEHFCKQDGPFSIWIGKDFGGCFEQLVIVSPVYVLLTCICVYYIAKASCSPILSGNINRMWIVYLRLLFHVAIICGQIAFIIEQYLASESLAIVTTISQTLILLAWCLSSLVVLLWRRGWHSVNTGRDFDLLGVSWFLALLSCSFELHSAVLSYIGKDSALDDGEMARYEYINIFIRWCLYCGVLLLQIPKSNVPVSVSAINGISVINGDEEAGSSRGLNVPEIVSEHSFPWTSRLTFHWVTALFTAAQHSQFPSISDLPFTLPPSMNPISMHCKLKLAMRHYSTPYFPPLMTQTDADGNHEDLMQPLLQHASENDSTTEKKFVLLKSLNKAFGWSFWPLNIIKLVSAVLELSSPVILNLLLRDLESGSDNIASAVVYLAVLVFTLVLNAFIETHLEYEVNKLQISMKGSIITELYAKVLSVNAAGLRSFTVGEISNFASQDGDNISSHLVCFFEIWYMPLKLIVIFYMLYRYIGISFLAGIGFCVVLIPLNQWIATKLHTYEDNLMKHRDSRLKLVHEVITNIKSIKLFSWEDQFVEKIAKLRTTELFELRRIAYLDAICVYFWASAPCLITFLIILTYSLLGGEVSASLIFTTLALVDQVILPLNALPWVIMGFVMAWVSTKRVQSFFGLAENAPHRVAVGPPFQSHNVVEVDNCSFYWKKPDDCCLVNLHFQVNKGELMIVMGKTGSGKTSLLLALSQELNIASGELRLKEWKEGTGTVLQDCCIKHGTVRETILDGSVFDLYWYEQVVSACALDKDISNFPDGDNTPVGINGAALSGGQRLRLALARAVYKNKQVYLIDDIFSGLDSNVVLHIYEHCINGLLANKTRIICTHNSHLCSYADSMMVLEDGQIKYIGLPQVTNLPKADDKEYTTDTITKDDKEDNEVESQKKQYEEMRYFGAVGVTVYKHYTKAAGCILTCIVLFSLTGMQVTATISNWWLSVWIKAVAAIPSVAETLTRFAVLVPNTGYDNNGADFTIDGYLGKTSSNLSDYPFFSEKPGMSVNSTFYLTVYGSIIVANTVFVLVRSFSFAVFGIAAAKTLHDNMLKTVMKSALHFFDKTPVGVILNRFASDIYTVDGDLPFELNILMAEFFTIVGTLVMTCYGLPYILLTVIPLMVLYYFIQKYYRNAVREVKRLYSMARSPLFSHFEETVNSLVYIHGFRMCDSVQNTGIKYLKDFQRSDFCLNAASAWLSLRLQLLAAGVVLVAAGIILIEMYYDAVDAAILGLALTYALTINNTLKELITSITSVEKQFVGAERVLQYTQNLPIEVEKEDLQLVDYAWPTLGTIQFSNVSVRYKDCATRALNHITFKINGGEKVAIVGRTGAGKSTIFLALFRLCDIETGYIIIDNANIHDISSKVLREKLSVLPQDPLVFTGSIRENIDPLNKYSDEQIKETLARCRVLDSMKSNDGLDSEISHKTLSAGQRQLFSLARALLNKSKILCLDEATSNIDHETDQILQNIIRQDFKDSTIVTVAHRLETVMDYDRVLVVSHGAIVEDGVPRKLLDNSRSVFYKLAQSSGLVPTNSKVNSLASTSAFLD